MMVFNIKVFKTIISVLLTITKSDSIINLLLFIIIIDEIGLSLEIGRILENIN